MKQEIEISAGRSLFGINPVNYSEVRPDYPEEFYQRLVACSCNDLLDVASGDGRIARQLRGRTAMNVTLLEPDDRFSPFLDDIDGAAVHCASFEEAVFDRQSFDLITVGTAFHWLDSVTRISRVSGLLKPGGYVALLWHVFSDSARRDPFHEATRTILQDLEISPSAKSGEKPFALRKNEREMEFTGNGRFQLADYLEQRWSLVLDAQEVGKLYSTFSDIQRLDDHERENILLRLMKIADDEFSGKVIRHVTSVMYLFRKNPR